MTLIKVSFISQILLSDNIAYDFGYNGCSKFHLEIWPFQHVQTLCAERKKK